MKQHPTWSTLLLSTLSIVVCWSPAQALTQVATAVATRGEVQAIDSAGASRSLAPKSAVYEKDTIKTGERGQVQLLFTDNSIISLGRQSEMKVEEYRWQAEQHDGALKTKIKEGTFRVMGGALATSAPQNFTTETPTATIGIRGSMYAGKATAQTLAVVFQGGKGIDITNALGTVAITQPGFGTRVEIAKPPLPPVKFAPQDLMEFNQSLGSAKSEPAAEGSAAGRPAEEPNEAEAGADSGALPSGDGGVGPGGEPSPAGDSSAVAETTLSGGFLASSPASQDTSPLLSPGAVFLEPTTSVIANLQTSVVSVTAQTDLTTTVDQTTATIVADRRLPGRYYFFRRDIDLSLPVPTDFRSTFLDYLSGAVDAFIYNSGQIQGTLSDGTAFGPYLISGYAPAAASYGGYGQITGVVNYLDPILGAIPLKVATLADPSGQFFYSAADAIVSSATTDYLLASLLFAGAASGNTPSNRIDEFAGQILHATTTPGSNEANLELTKIEVNYYNKRLIGRTASLDPNQGNKERAIFFGSIDSTGAANVTILAGGSTGGSEVSTAYGSGSGLLYGAFHQGLAFTASGNDYSLLSNVQGNAWVASGAAMRAASEIISLYPTSPIPLAGFVVGAADDTSTGKVSHIFMNSQASEFTMTANPTSGVISGSITAPAKNFFSGATEWLSTLAVGGSAASSAYVLNDQMVATLAAVGANPTLRNYGNFLATAGPDALPLTNLANAEYLTWGSWEMAYTDPVDASRDHLFSSQSFWVAGQQTPSTYMSTNLLSHAIVGTYDGKAFGMQVDAAGQNASALTNGAAHVVIDFNTAVPTPVTGAISFDQAVLTLSSAASTINPNGFTASVPNVTRAGINASPLSSAVNGAFYGPAAEAVGGNFSAKMSSGIGYYGIFGGNR